MTKVRCLIVLALLIGIVGCAANQSFEKNAYNTLASAAETYTATMSSAAELYKKDLITDTEKDRIIEYGGTFWVAYQVAVDALAEYLRTKDKAGVYSSMASLSKALSAFLTYAQTILEDK